MMCSYRSLWIAAAACFLLHAGCEDDGPVRDATVDGMANDAGVDAMAPDASAPDQAPAKVRGEVIILHTNDMHSHLSGMGPTLEHSPATTNDDSTRGGFARLSAMIAAERAAAGDAAVLLLDAGDFTMGTPFAMLVRSHAVELAEMQAMGYDAMALGNHEFDLGPQALAEMIEKGKTGGFDVPLLATNIVFDASSADDDGLEALVQGGTIRRKLVKTLDNGLKVGFFSLLGHAGAGGVALTAPKVAWTPIAEAAKAVVAELRDVDKVDLVIALSHSGVDDAGAGEDADLAKSVPGIDVIVSGHTHTVLEQPVKVNDTWIVQTGSFGRHLGRVQLQVFDDGSTDVASYALLAVDDETKGDPVVQGRIEGYIAEIDKLIAPLSYRTVVAEIGFDTEFSREHPFVELALGDLVTDAYIYAVSALEPSEPPQVAFEAPGALRDPLLKGSAGQLALADVYRVVSTGSGPDGKPGWPLVTFYVNGNELKIAAEVVALASDLRVPDYYLQIAGMKMTYDPQAGLFHRVTALSLTDGTPIDMQDTTKCYRLVIGLSLARELDKVGEVSGGALKIEPKEKDCATVIPDITSRIVDSDPAEGLQELKQHEALLKYVQGLPDADGDQIPDIPASYAKPEGRISAK